MGKKGKTSKNEKKDQWQPEICQYETLKDLITDQKTTTGKDFDEIKNKIKVLEESVNNKFDKIDVSLRGNGRIGAFEQLRSLQAKLEGYEARITKIYNRAKWVVKWLFRIGLIIFVFSIGGRFYYLTWDDIKGKFAGNETKQVDPNQIKNYDGR